VIESPGQILHDWRRRHDIVRRRTESQMAALEDGHWNMNFLEHFMTRASLLILRVQIARPDHI